VPSRSRSIAFVGVLALAASCQAVPEVIPDDARADVRLSENETTVRASVPNHATLETLLRRELTPDLSLSIVDAARRVFNPRELRAHQPYSIARTLDGLFREFRYYIDGDRFLRVVFRDNAPSPETAFEAEIVAIPKHYELATVSASITPVTNSLISAFDAVGETIHLPLALAEAYSGELDFNSDLRQGDRMDVLFERALRNGEFAGYGEVKAAVLEVGGRRVTAVRYVDQTGRAGWYDENGRSLKRVFLKSPLPFDPRVTSGFSSNRFHPVHGTRRPHLGVDYGAPYGTPVHAVASGVVVSAAWSGEGGRTVRIRHAGGYETAYLHLSSFGPGVRTGVRVDQGQLIGRVGQTGTATGPHLDYRIIKNGVYLNPVAELKKMPPGEPLPAEELEAFARERDHRLAELSQGLATASAVR
jgi:murein DD-endopeptidase MepM/ murein hydrolase activator NlpD